MDESILINIVTLKE